MWIPVWLMAAVYVLTILADETDTTNSYCALCSDHTMCMYKGPSARCRNLNSRELSAEERRAALHAHNAVRNKVAAGEEDRGYLGQSQLAASNMRKLHWDEELATIARRWASQCLFDQDTCRTTLDGSSVGQNIYMQMLPPGASQPPTVSVAAAVFKWAAEVDAFDGRQAVLPYSYSVSTWHYTNIVWARTSRLGCSFADFTAANGVSVRLIVCNYKEAGNVVGYPMYVTGRPASKCGGDGTSALSPPPPSPPPPPTPPPPLAIPPYPLPPPAGPWEEDFNNRDPDTWTASAAGSWGRGGPGAFQGGQRVQGAGRRVFGARGLSARGGSEWDALLAMEMVADQKTAVTETPSPSYPALCP